MNTWDNMMIKQGWQCPVCGKVHAPWMPECDCHKRTSVATTGTSTGKSESVTVHIPHSYEEWMEKLNVTRGGEDE